MWVQRIENYAPWIEVVSNKWIVFTNSLVIGVTKTSVDNGKQTRIFLNLAPDVFLDQAV